MLVVADEQLLEKMFNWLGQWITKLDSLTDFVREKIMFFWDHQFNSEAFLSKKLDILKGAIAYYEGQLATSFSRSVTYYHEQAVMNLWHFMKNHGFSKEDVEAFYKDYWHLYALRKQLLNEYLEQENCENAEALLKESKVLDASSLGLLSSHSEHLIAIYGKQGREEDLKKELVTYIFDYKNDDLESLFSLKQLLDENEWTEYCDYYLSDRQKRNRLEVMQKEKLFAQLLDEIMANRFYRLELLIKYEDDLKQYALLQVRDVILEDIDTQMIPVSDRQTYRHLASYLKKIRHYPEGDVLSQKVAQRWRVSYPRRKAMLEELSRAGF